MIRRTSRNVKFEAASRRFRLTSADALRLSKLAGPGKGRQTDAARKLQPPLSPAARAESTVMQPPLDAVEQHVGSVYRYALRLAGRADLAEDLAQETLLRGWKSRDKLRDPQVARVWLLRIATNVWMDHLRESRFRPRALECEPPCPRPAAAAISHERENVERALAEMDELPPRQRQVLYLTTCEGFSHAEVAEILAIGLPAVKANLSLAQRNAAATERCIRASLRPAGGPGVVMNLSDCENLDAFLADDLSPSEVSRFTAHLHECASCRDAVDQQGWIDGLLSSPILTELEAAARDDLGTDHIACCPAPPTNPILRLRLSGRGCTARGHWLDSDAKPPSECSNRYRHQRRSGDSVEQAAAGKAATVHVCRRPRCARGARRVAASKCNDRTYLSNLSARLFRPSERPDAGFGRRTRLAPGTQWRLAMCSRSFAQSICGHVSKAVMLCLATAWLVALAAIAVAQETEGSESRADDPVEQARDELNDVVVPGSDGVPTKGESGAVRRLREGKALIVGPSKTPASATTDGASIKQEFAAAEQKRMQQQLSLIRQRLQEMARRQKSLEARHREAIETLAQTLRTDNADDQATKAAVAQWLREQELVNLERKTLQREIQQLEAAALQVTAEATRQQQQQQQQEQYQQRRQEQSALPADATTKIFSLRNSQASAMARVLSEILDGKKLRMAVDERTNSLIVLGQKDTNDMVEALLLRLDESAAGSAKPAQSGETLQLRIIWLLDGVGEGKGPQEISINPEVIDSLHDLGFSDPRVVCQQVTTLTLNEDGRGGFNFTVPVLVNAQPWDFEGHGDVESMAGERFNLKFDLGFHSQVAGAPGGGADRQGAQLGGSIFTPLGHYTVMGTTTFVSTDASPTADGAQPTQQQHLSAFVVYFDRAREFPAKTREAKQ